MGGDWYEDAAMLLADFISHYEVPAGASDRQALTGGEGQGLREGASLASRETVCEWLRKVGAL